MSSPEQDPSIWQDNLVIAVLGGLGTLLILAIFAYLWVWKLDDLFFYRCIVPWRIWRLERTLPERKEHTKDRLETIDRWLVKKTIISQEECGCAGNSSSSVVSGGADEYYGDDGSRKIPECGICLQPLKADGRRTVGVSVVCQHAFCFGCIRQWLVSHKTCPECREVYLRIDVGAPGREYLDKSWSFLPGLEEHERLVAERRTRERCCKFCEKEGLVLTDDLEAQQQQATTTKHRESIELSSVQEVVGQRAEARLNLHEPKPAAREAVTQPTDGLTDREQANEPTLHRAVSGPTAPNTPTASTNSKRRQSWA